MKMCRALWNNNGLCVVSMWRMSFEFLNFLPLNKEKMDYDKTKEVKTVVCWRKSSM